MRIRHVALQSSALRCTRSEIEILRRLLRKRRLPARSHVLDVAVVWPTAAKRHPGARMSPDRPLIPVQRAESCVAYRRYRQALVDAVRPVDD